MRSTGQQFAPAAISELRDLVLGIVDLGNVAMEVIGKLSGSSRGVGTLLRTTQVVHDKGWQCGESAGPAISAAGVADIQGIGSSHPNYR